jgi:hypothetical protein
LELRTGSPESELEPKAPVGLWRAVARRERRESSSSGGWAGTRAGRRASCWRSAVFISAIRVTSVVICARASWGWIC